MLRMAAFLSTTNSTVLDKDKEEVTDYFNNNGFERWNKIYSDSDEVNGVQLDIRTGHAQTIDKVKTTPRDRASSNKSPRDCYNARASVLDPSLTITGCSLAVAWTDAHTAGCIK